MKSIVLCETSFVQQTERMTEEEKSKSDSGGVETLEKSNGDGAGNSVIASGTVKTCQVDESTVRKQEESVEVKKELTNGDANDSVNCRTNLDLNKTPDECDSNGIKKDVDSDERTKIPEESDAEANVNSVNYVTKFEAKTEKSEADDRISDTQAVDGENATDVSEGKTEEIGISNGTPEKESLSKGEICSDRPADVSSGDGAFDEEGNKENEKIDSDKPQDVFTIEDDETMENATGPETTSEESGSNKYNIHVSDCQSVSVQDEDVSWGELQNAESSKDYEADASDESKEPADYCLEPPENNADQVEAEVEAEAEAEAEAEEDSKPLEGGAESEIREGEIKIEEGEEIKMEEETAPTKSEERDAETAAEDETASIEDRFVIEEASIEIDAETVQHEEEASVTLPEKTEGDSRKRSGSERPEEKEPKRRKTEDEEGVSYVDSEDEDVDDPLPCSSPPTFSDDSDAQVENFENEKKRILNIEEAHGESESKKLKLSSDDPEKPSEKTKTNLEECIDRVATNKRSLPFLDNLRGTLKNLTRSDLEELTVQKLCEVITERSTVGELRRRAQALEQDQEKWKEKVQSLTKQMREMEMVMKKYMSEVQKQNKEKNFQIVTPIRVTRSVGLQVSFLPNVSKSPRIPPGQSPALNSASQFDKRGVKCAMTKTPLQINANAVSPNMRNKPLTPTTSPRTILSPQKNIVQVKKNFPPRPGVNALLQNRPIAPQPLMNSNRLQQNQIATIRPTFKVAAAPPQQQTGSKIIDLTDDDDKQMNQKALQVTPGVRNQPGTVRVVNSLQQPQMNQNSRVAYLVPATTTSTTGTGTPNRQFVIATSGIPTQNRQIVSSMPPLIFKGGNFVPAGAQATLVNQNIRPLAPKQFRHPAPLPQPPPNQIHRPNWKLLPPRPALKISRVQTGIVLSWNMNLGPEYEPVASYQLYAYQESNSPPTTSLWKKVGDVKALPLPMACTLTQFMTGHKYHFAVRAVDVHSRIGPFSVPNFIVL